MFILLFYTFLGTMGKKIASTLVLLDQKIASCKIFRQMFCWVCFPLQRQGDEDIPDVLWLMGVSGRIIFREPGKVQRKYRLKQSDREKEQLLPKEGAANREDVTCIFLHYTFSLRESMLFLFPLSVLQ